MGVTIKAGTAIALARAVSSHVLTVQRIAGRYFVAVPAEVVASVLSMGRTSMSAIPADPQTYALGAVATRRGSFCWSVNGI